MRGNRPGFERADAVRGRRCRRSRALAGAAIAAAVAVPAMQAAGASTTANWKTATSGRWAVPSFWSTSPVYPNNGTPAGTTYDVVLDATGSNYTVTLDAGPVVVIDSLALPSPNATLSLNTGGTLQALNGVTASGGTFSVVGGTVRNTSLDGTTDSVRIRDANLDSVRIAHGATIIETNSGTTPPNTFTTVTNGLTLGTNAGDAANLSISQVQFVGTQTIGGKGTLTFFQPYLSGPLLAARSGTLTIGPDVTVQGSFFLNEAGGRIVNQGTLRAASGQRLVVSQPPSNNDVFMNKGVMEAKAGGTLVVEAPLDGTGGTLRADGGTVVISGSSFYNTVQTTSKFGTLSATNGGSFQIGGSIANAGTTFAANAATGNIEIGGTITGGTLVTADGAEFWSRRGSQLNNLTLAGTFDLRPPTRDDGGTLVLSNVTFGGGGLVTLQSRLDGARASVDVPSGVLGGTGTIRFDGLYGQLYGTEVRSSGGSGTLGPGITVVTGIGSGTVGTLTNQGLILAQDGKTISLDRVQNQGLIESKNNGLIDGNTLDNRGVVSVDNARFQVASGWSNASGGAILATRNALLTLVPPTAGLGTLNANGSQVNLTGGTFTGFSGVTLANSSVLSVPGNVVVNLGSDTFSIFGASRVSLSGGKVIGGTIAGGTAGGSVVATANNTSTLDGVTLGVPVDVQGGGTLAIANGLTLQGNVTLGLNSGTTAATAAKVQITGAAGVGGAGSIVFNGAAVPGQISVQGATEIGQNVTVRTGTGSGTFTTTGTLTNKGTIAAGTNGQTLTLSAPSIDNRGRIAVSAGGTMVLPAVQNVGTIDVTTPSTLTLTGSWSNAAPGVINVDRTGLTLGGTFPATSIAGIRLNGAGSFVTLAGTAQNASDATIDLAPLGAVRIGTGAAIVNGRVSGGTTGSLVGGGANAAITLRDVTLAAPLSLPTGGTINFDGAWSVATGDGGSVNANAATINLGGSFRRADAAAIKQTAGVINFSGVLDNSGGTLTLDDSTGTWNVIGGTVRGGTLRTAGNAKFFVPRGQSASLDGVTLDADLPLTASTLTVSNGLTLAVARQITGNGGTTVAFNGATAQSLGGTGTLAFDSNPANLIINDSADVATIDAGVTVHGQAVTIHGGAKGIINRGTIVADGGGGGGRGGTVHLFDVDNQGNVRVANGAALTARGTLGAPSNGSLVVDGGSLTAGSIDASNAGEFTFTGGRVEIDRGTLTPKGSTFDVPAGGTLAGTGTVAGGVNNGGALAPGRPATSGILNVAGDYAQGGGGSLKVDVGGANAGTGYDRLAITRLAALGGTLELSRLNAFAPVIGQSFTVLTAESRTGTFSSVVGQNAGNGLVFALTYTPTSVVATAAMPGDIDMDRVVGAGDFNVLATHFGQSVSSWGDGDLDGDGVVGPGDFNLLATNFGHAAPGLNASVTPADWAVLTAFAQQSVPEPAVGGTCAAVMAVLLTRRRRT